jgi:hypothetical protein
MRDAYEWGSRDGFLDGPPAGGDRLFRPIQVRVGIPPRSHVIEWNLGLTGAVGMGDEDAVARPGRVELVPRS